jgi:hypothetical protein
MRLFNYLISIIGLSIIQPLVSIAQDLKYAHEVVNILASEDMKGRGYVQNGSKLAANYIIKEFEKMGLQPISQLFTSPVNTFPESMSVKINTAELKPGIDFIVDAGSPSVKGVYNTILLKPDDLLREDRFINKLKSAKGKFIQLQAYNKKEYNKDDIKKMEEFINFLKYSPENPSEGTLILTKDKLTWDVSVTQYSKPCITIKVDSLFPEFESVTLNIKSKFVKKYESKNIITIVEGKRSDSLILLTAHYDHLGMMGDKTIFAGANDNASGVAMLLNLAKYYAKNKPEFTIVFIAFAGEEIGLVGSKYFIEHPTLELNKIKFLINFDLAGTGDEGIQVVNGTIFKNKFDLLSKLNEEQHLLTQVKVRGEACNSDHCFFYQKKVPCFFIYTLGGIQAYHDVYDRAETLPLTKFEEYFKLMLAFIKEL